MNKKTIEYLYFLVSGTCIFSILAIYLFEFKADYTLLLKGIFTTIFLEYILKRIIK